MRHFIFAQEGYWLTQSVHNRYRPRVFVKAIPVNYPYMWVQWSDEQKKIWESKNGPMKITDLWKYYNNFDYSKTGGFFGEVNEK